MKRKIWIAMVLVSTGSFAATTPDQDAAFLAAFKLWLSQNNAVVVPPVAVVFRIHPTLFTP
jgi:hypothetical protein